jgi:hypothetical protein
MINAIKSGFLKGAAVGVVLGIIAVAMSLAEDIPNSVPMAVFFAMYPVSGGAAGVIAGALSGFATSRRRAQLVGIIAAIPVALVFVTAVSGPPSRWAGSSWFAAIMMSILVGWVGGSKVWDTRMHRAVEKR